MKNLIRIPKTAEEILCVLKQASYPLSIKDIAKIMGKSERTIRRYIRLLFEKGLVLRDAIETKSKRVAYSYFIPSKELLEKSVHEELKRILRIVYGSD